MVAALLYKSDWPAARERLAAWWRREAMDRPAIEVTAPRDRPIAGPEPPPKTGRPEEDWLDFEAVLARQEGVFRRTAFLGEAYPGVEVSLGPGVLGALLGARCSFQERTVWYDPCFDGPASAHLAWDDERPLWRWTLKNTALALERGAGRWVVDLPDLIENVDTLAALVGTEALLIALAVSPDEIHRLQRSLLPLWFRAYEPLWECVSAAEGGAGWLCFKAWAPGRMAKLQCDLSAMISPAMFDDLVAPYLVEQAAGIDFCLYHLDGPDAVKHLDTVLSIPGLDVLQWSPGAGQAHGGDPAWDGVYRAALDAGKGIQAYMPIEAVPAFVRRLGRRGVYIETRAPSEAEAERLLRAVAAPKKGGKNP